MFIRIPDVIRMVYGIPTQILTIITVIRAAKGVPLRNLIGVWLPVIISMSWLRAPPFSARI